MREILSVERQRFTTHKLAYKEFIRVNNPYCDEVIRILHAQSRNPYIEVQKIIRDATSGKIIDTSTLVPYLILKHHLTSHFVPFIKGFQNHTPEVNTELVVRRQLKK